MSKTFKAPPAKVSFPKLEREVLELWKRQDTFAKLRAKNLSGPKLVFLEGPPTANGIPHIGHALTRAVKDVYLRYWLMNGRNIVPYIAGWDCHGLPVEIEVEKEMGFTSKPDILGYGIERFNEVCRISVMRYRDKWEEMSARIGFWLDMKHPYVTMEPKYIESVWWSLKQLHSNGLLEKGHYVVPYCPRCGTPLSSHEVAQGYRSVRELSVTLKFKLAKPYPPAGENGYILAWTTTPWTLPGNVALAVGKDITYAVVEQKGERYILANDLVDRVIQGDYNLLCVIKGSEMVGWRYEPLFDFIDLREPGKRAYEVVEGGFVTTEEGTGVVHTAVMYGEDDYLLGTALGLPAVHTVDAEGKFNALVNPWQGRFVKEEGLDVEISTYLHEHNRLYARADCEHSYPFCWRCDSPLLYYALDTWFIRMSRLRSEMLSANEVINWIPEHLKHGRFGNFLDELKDWALSRNRFWGTPLPIWSCAQGHEVCLGGFEELAALTGALPDDFDPHRPFVDELGVRCPECGDRMAREPYVIDTWYDSGAAFFAQYHYPFENVREFESSFPVDFITEALDQTRGWFYTLLAIGVSVFHRHTYRNVLTMGLILDDTGHKMSKSKGNVVLPEEVTETFGADAVRLNFYQTPVWNSYRFTKEGVHETLRKDINTLWNVYAFFANNASIDGYTPQPAEPVHELDRWLLSRLNSLLLQVRNAMERYELHVAAGAISEFIDDLSNWYLRRSRRRFWLDGMDDKVRVYSTLYRVLTRTAILSAPFIPFLSEYLYQQLVVEIDPTAPESVHLCPYPEVEEVRSPQLEKEMMMVIGIARAGRNARQKMNIKLRQPLSRAVVVCSPDNAERLGRFADILKEELNVKEIIFAQEIGDYLDLSIKPNHASLGPKFGADAPRISVMLAHAPAADVIKALERDGRARIGDHVIERGDVVVESRERPGCSSSSTAGITVIVHTTLTPDLLSEGMARDIVRRIQTMRSTLSLAYDQGIHVWLCGDRELLKAARAHSDYIKQETLATTLTFEEGKGLMEEWKIDGRSLQIWVEPL